MRLYGASYQPDDMGEWIAEAMAAEPNSTVTTDETVVSIESRRQRV